MFKVVSAVMLFGNLVFKSERNNDQAILPDNTSKAAAGQHQGEPRRSLRRRKLPDEQDMDMKEQNQENEMFLVSLTATFLA